MSLKLARPSTAPSKQLPQKTAFDLRPLGRSPMPVKLQTAVISNNIQSQISSLKSEVLMLQKRCEEVRPAGPSHAESEALEKKLLSLQPTFGDEPLHNLDVKCSLLELLLEQIKNLSFAALGRCDADMGSMFIPTRCSAFLKLIEYVVGVAERKKAWDEKLTHDRAAVEAAVDGTARPKPLDSPYLIDSMDLALNEPTAAEVRKLAQEQRAMQEQLRAVLERHVLPQVAPSAKPGQTAGAPTAQTPSAASVDKKKERKQSTTATPEAGSGTPPPSATALQVKYDALVKESAELRKRIAQLEKENKDQQAVSEKTEEESNGDVAKRIRGMAFGADKTRLMALGVSLPARSILSEHESQSILSKIGSILQETSQQLVVAPAAQTASTPNKSGTSSPTPTAASVVKGGQVLPAQSNEGLLWLTLHQQSIVLTQVLNKFYSAEERNAALVNEKQADIDRLRRTISNLEQRIQLLKVQSTKSTVALQAEMQKHKEDADHYKKLYSDHVTVAAAAPNRIVNAKGQVATAEEREKTLKEEVANRQQSIGDLTAQLKALKARIEEEQCASAAVARERLALIQARDAEAAKVKKLQQEASEREEVLQNAKDNVASLKREVRDRTAAETEIQQRAWKLEVELHIAQNVITELRQRECELNRATRDAQACREDLQEEVHRLRDVLSATSNEYEAKLREAHHELGATRSMLAEERQKLLAQEKETERLRIVDLKMESLEQSFTNYAASKIAQREAGEEEERMLGECLDSLEADPFHVPAEHDGEAQIQLYKKTLLESKEQYEADERVRQRSHSPNDERTKKKRLYLLLHSRFIEIQLFACNYRLQQMKLERENRNMEIEIKTLQESQDSIFAELSQARVQCDALAHRNSELEAERKQFLKTRTEMETEMKTLRANAQRLRVSHDEQEKLLVELGTRLQSARIEIESRSGTPAPLPNTVMTD
jgi:hypothetical protein